MFNILRLIPIAKGVKHFVEREDFKRVLEEKKKENERFVLVPVKLKNDKYFVSIYFNKVIPFWEENFEYYEGFLVFNSEGKVIKDINKCSEIIRVLIIWIKALKENKFLDWGKKLKQKAIEKLKQKTKDLYYNCKNRLEYKGYSGEPEFLKAEVKELDESIVYNFEDLVNYFEAYIDLIDKKIILLNEIPSRELVEEYINSLKSYDNKLDGFTDFSKKRKNIMANVEESLEDKLSSYSKLWRVLSAIVYRLSKSRFSILAWIFLISLPTGIRKGFSNLAGQSGFERLIDKNQKDKEKLEKILNIWDDERYLSENIRN